MKTWFGLMISLMIYCVSFLLLVRHQAGLDPPLELCTFQASMIYAAPPLVCFCGLAFVIELYLRIHPAIFQVQLNEKHIVLFLHLAPFVHSAVAWEALLSGLHTVQRDSSRMYCNVSSRGPPMVTGVTVVIFLIAMLSFEVSQLCCCIVNEVLHANLMLKVLLFFLWECSSAQLYIHLQVLELSLLLCCWILSIFFQIIHHEMLSCTSLHSFHYLLPFSLDPKQTSYIGICQCSGEETIKRYSQMTKLCPLLSLCILPLLVLPRNGA